MLFEMLSYLWNFSKLKITLSTCSHTNSPKHVYCGCTRFFGECNVMNELCPSTFDLITWSVLLSRNSWICKSWSNVRTSLIFALLILSHLLKKSLEIYWVAARKINQVDSFYVFNATISSAISKMVHRACQWCRLCFPDEIGNWSLSRVDSDFSVRTQMMSRKNCIFINCYRLTTIQRDFAEESAFKS